MTKREEIDRHYSYEGLGAQLDGESLDFFYKAMDLTSSCFDVDRWCHLNTLFGYTIPFDAAMQITNWLYENEDVCCGETLEVTYNDEIIISYICTQLGLDLDFSKWRDTDFVYYEYFD